MHWLSQSKTYGRYHDFAAPSPPRDWHGGPFPTHGELAHGLSLTMGPTRTASSLRFFSPQWPETWLSPGSCAKILVRFERPREYFPQNTNQWRVTDRNKKIRQENSSYSWQVIISLIVYLKKLLHVRNDDKNCRQRYASTCALHVAVL